MISIQEEALIKSDSRPLRSMGHLGPFITCVERTLPIFQMRVHQSMTVSPDLSFWHKSG